MTHTRRSMFLRFTTCLRFEFLKLLPRRLPWITLLVIGAATAFTGWIESGSEQMPTGWWLFTLIVGKTLPLLAFFLVIMGCLSINEEISSGAMRAVLVRPVSRAELLTAKMFSLLAFSLVGVALAYGAACLWVLAHGGFGSVVHDFEGFQVEKFTSEEIRSHALTLTAATLPGLLCAPLFGVLVSLLVEASGSAVAIGVFLFFCMKTLSGLQNMGGIIQRFRECVFTTYIDRPLVLLGELSEGIEENLRNVEQMNVLSSDYVAPLAMLLGLAACSLLVFHRKEIQC